MLCLSGVMRTGCGSPDLFWHTCDPIDRLPTLTLVKQCSLFSRLGLMGKDMTKPMFRAASLTRTERRTASRRLWSGVGKRASALVFLLAKNLLFWGSMVISGFALYSLVAWLI